MYRISRIKCRIDSVLNEQKGRIKKTYRRSLLPDTFWYYPAYRYNELPHNKLCYTASLDFYGSTKGVSGYVRDQYYKHLFSTSRGATRSYQYYDAFDGIGLFGHFGSVDFEGDTAFTSVQSNWIRSMIPAQYPVPKAIMDKMAATGCFGPGNMPLPELHTDLQQIALRNEFKFGKQHLNKHKKFYH